MSFSYYKIGDTIAVLSDLIEINNDRITCYQSVLDRSLKLDAEVRESFLDIISLSTSYRQQLTGKIGGLKEHIKTTVTVPGTIYKAWQDLRVAIPNTSQRTIIGSCLYNEDIVLYAYKAALSTSVNNDEDAFAMISAQEYGLKKNRELLRGYREMHKMAETSLMYFS